MVSGRFIMWRDPAPALAGILARAAALQGWRKLYRVAILTGRRDIVDVA